MNTKKMAWLAMLMPRGKDFPRFSITARFLGPESRWSFEHQHVRQFISQCQAWLVQTT